MIFAGPRFNKLKPKSIVLHRVAHIVGFLHLRYLSSLERHSFIFLKITYRHSSSPGMGRVRAKLFFNLTREPDDRKNAVCYGNAFFVVVIHPVR